jgi:hypothetical protein
MEIQNDATDGLNGRQLERGSGRTGRSANEGPQASGEGRTAGGTRWQEVSDNVDLKGRSGVQSLPCRKACRDYRHLAILMSM